MNPRAPLLLILLMSLAGQCAAQLPPSARLGRLFSTPAERALLDNKRGAAPLAPVNANTPAGEGTAPGGPAFDTPAGAAPPPGPPPVELNGLLRSSSGRTTTWLNAEPSAAGTAAVGGKAVTLRLSSGRKLLIKPGQTYDAISGAVQEGTSAAPDAAVPSPEVKQ